jgi:hypothetical protein
MHATTIIRTVCILTSLHASMWTRVWQINVHLKSSGLLAREARGVIGAACGRSISPP